MFSFYAYQKLTVKDKTLEFRFPVDDEGNFIGQELATIDGVTYVSLPSDLDLPDQHDELSMYVVDMTDDLRKKICKASPYVRMVNEAVAAMIHDLYSIDDEIKLIRTAPSDDFDEYNAFAENCRQWGRDKKAEVGL